MPQLSRQCGLRGRLLPFRVAEGAWVTEPQRTPRVLSHSCICPVTRVAVAGTGGTQHRPTPPGRLRGLSGFPALRPGAFRKLVLLSVLPCLCAESCQRVPGPGDGVGTLLPLRPPPSGLTVRLGICGGAPPRSPSASAFPRWSGNSPSVGFAWSSLTL